MEFKEIEVLIDKINSSEISLFEVKMDNFYIKMDKSLVRDSFKVENETFEAKEDFTEDKKINYQEKSNDIANEMVATHEDENLHVVKSPMVGTFYIAPGVDLNPFVKVGSNVKKGDTLCIIEAMKLMNELECDINGEIVEILVNDGEMVEYGAELFKIRR